MKKLLGLTLLLTACATIQAPDTEATIKRNDEAFAAAVGRGDVDKILSFYADDAELLPPNAPRFRGRAAIRQFWTGFMATGKLAGTLTPDRIIHSCDMATEVGHYDLTITPSGAAPIHDNGKYAVTWKIIGGEWRIVVDMFSSNNPPPR